MRQGQTMKDFYHWKSATIKAHGGLEKTDTSMMDEYSRYTKHYFCGDGTIIIEENGPAWIDIDTELGKMKGVKVFRSECYTSKDGTTHVFYELY